MRSIWSLTLSIWVLWVSVCGGDGVSRDGTMCSAPSSCWTCSSITDDMHSSKHHIQPEHVMHITVLSALIGPESHVMHTSRLSAISVVVYQSMETLLCAGLPEHVIWVYIKSSSWGDDTRSLHLTCVVQTYLWLLYWIFLYISLYNVYIQMTLLRLPVKISA